MSEFTRVFLATSDYVESCFIILAVWFSWKGAMKIHKDKELKGVYWPTWMFYTLWEIYKLPYYFLFHQYFSATFDILMILVDGIAIYGVYLIMRESWLKNTRIQSRQS